MIPTQLQKDEFRFLKLSRKDKIPIERGWQTDKNYKYNDKVILDWIANGNNYGVVCGIGELLVIDADLPEVIEAVKNLPPTFTVKTKQGYHYYYKCPCERKQIMLRGGKHYGELQAKGSQVVGVGSVHPSGEIYKVDNDVPIAEVNYEDVKKYLKDFLPLEIKKTPITAQDLAAYL